MSIATDMIVANGADRADVAMLPTVGDWFVLRTRSRQEKILAGELTAMGIGAYLPLARQVRTYAGRRVHVEVPLFPGYVFLRGDRDQGFQADRTRRVAQMICATRRELEWELRNIAAALAVHCELLTYPTLQCGVRVQVISGPLRGLQGVIESRAKIDRLILQVDMLGQAVSVELDGALLEAIYS